MRNVLPLSAFIRAYLRLKFFGGDQGAANNQTQFNLQVVRALGEVQATGKPPARVRLTPAEAR